MSEAALTDHLSAAKVQRILLVLLLICAPHFLHIPLWISAIALAIGIWRGFAAARTWAMPHPRLRQLATVVGFGGILLQFGTPNGHQAGVALLVLMLALKLTEMTRRRDYLLVIYLSYFLLITHFLFSQEMAMLGLLFAGTLAITMVLIDINHPQQVLPWRHSARLASGLLLQAIPLMVIFFLLFPRIPGPLWGLPSDAGAGMTGLGNSMEPGSINALGLSDEVAFRVRFKDTVPAREKLYWRGPVFEFFDGRKWIPGQWKKQRRRVDVQFNADPVEYEMQLEPSGKKWLLALDVPLRPLPANAEVGPDLTLRAQDNISARMLFQARSVLEYQVDLELPPAVKQRHLQYPSAFNQRTAALAQRWQQENPNDALAIVRQALRYFQQQPFSYTLRPPLLQGYDGVDEFLFETRRGFCEHYASAFTLLMRAAGVPARVVTGYQGAENNGDYYIVRQSDAHAWSEVWIEGRGWLRVDPTGAVAPERIELGLGGALPAGEPVPGLARMNRNVLLNLQLRWDQVNALWNRWVLAYGPELQESLLKALGLPGLRAMLITLTILTLGTLIIINSVINRGGKPLSQTDPVFALWLRYLQKLQRAGIQVPDAQGPQDLLLLLEQRQPIWLAEARHIHQLYIRLRYASREPDRQLLRRFKRHIRQFSPKRKSALSG